MAHGRPDFFGTSIHPKYGSSYRDIATELITAGTEETIITVTGSGTLVGGILYSTFLNVDPSDKITIKIDDRVLCEFTWAKLLALGIRGEFSYPISLSAYNSEANYYCCCFPLELPFEKSLSILYESVGLANVTVTVELSFYKAE